MTLPTLLVVHDQGSAGPLRVLSSARGLGRVVFLCEPRHPAVAAELGQVAGHAEVVDITGLDDAEVCRLAAGLSPDGIVTFSEHRLRLTAAVAAHCGLRFHSPEVTDALTDKFRQRQALAGVQDTACVLLRHPDDCAGALARVGTPAVLKPRHGAGSVDTCLVGSPAECRDRLAEFTEDTPGDFVLEEYLPGDPGLTPPGWGDYVSVESLVVDGEPRTVTVTGKPPLAPPFRETGHILPAPVPAALAADVVELEQRALRALGIRHGVTHTEVKLTADGPRIIEVNGRLGGNVAEITQRRMGYDMVGAALRLALGLPVTAPEPLRPGREAGPVAFQYMLIPPADPVSPGPLSLIESLADLPGVDLVDVRAPDSHHAGWRRGTLGAIGVIYGTAGSHTQLAELLRQLQTRAELYWYGATSAPAVRSGAA
ncbi:acetyl-CoA carboxylase biotin carboxylase subunit family protein [Streptomyces sp. TLI_185]|uniref:ATP-grasp domain-containing protein n=1 Tax=Streptomyces sp. TLI_185 TaxID=2485151 RepID=UPI000F50D8B1|nr:ATP-grasp domain-containing protein [Streptomyces sp. TLI_185]RPF35123.1 ATP-grasp domain-containing protein [Streptomyces sp. TLI_185]